MNPTFKKDIESVFFTDFAERVDFCGIRLNAVITKQHINPKMTGKFMETMDADILIREGMKVSIRKKDFPVTLKIGEEATVNKEKYLILDIVNRLGIVHFYLQRFAGK
ncbi:MULTISPECIES: hypothetical protein [Fusobacterium]|uniref:Uncharacterized protein n=2 Tax=Fusobacterium TaxID=848 RepID=A0AAN4AS89_9FUSO|nr:MULTISPECIES: hypothetical protein [Fusobacterium]EJU15573.1 hypothetical protein HMPREF1127_2035 [Fusobacterium necrophorum subsp. funduliforme Fnf 1007]KXA14554.1 hypothetical protein HMPREF3206_00977 [Fusobacterium equinum]MDK4477472.1 hypothetical protein [Fusobacterium necrophorum]MDK4486107.1 hypothetical protein [Fusobacterium necrophorum]